MLPVVVGFTALCAVVDWVGVWFRLRWVEGAARPFTTIGFIGIALTLGAMDSLSGQLLVVALGFTLVSDVSLVTWTRRNFLGGVSAAVVARAAYVSCFVVVGLEDTAMLRRAGIALLGCALLTPRIPIGLLRRSGRAIFVPVALHVTVTAVLVLAGALTGDERLFAGATCLLVGDIFLARDSFVRARWFNVTLAAVAHQGGHALILLGILR